MNDNFAPATNERLGELIYQLWAAIHDVGAEPNSRLGTIKDTVTELLSVDRPADLATAHACITAAHNLAGAVRSDFQHDPEITETEGARDLYLWTLSAVVDLNLKASEILTAIGYGSEGLPAGETLH